MSYVSGPPHAIHRIAINTKQHGTQQRNQHTYIQKQMNETPWYYT